MSSTNNSAGERPEAELHSPFFAFSDGSLLPCSRELLAEEPLSIILEGETIATLMRTPGHEEDLALGLLLTEGFIRSVEEVGAISLCREGLPGGRNEARIHLGDGVKPRRLLPMNRMVFSSCGICGTEMIEEVAVNIMPFHRSAHRLTPDDIFNLADAMNTRQELFKRTGAAHGAALAIPPIRDDSGIVVHEDVGRHNALDKAIGAAARKGILRPESLLLLSSRLSFEMVAKAARAGISDVVAFSAPSALAVKLGRTLNMFLAGFVRNRAMTVYSGRNALQIANNSPLNE